ncbi:DNA cytosine methyltransferase [Haloarculaceae archaeon H-GB1-1]|nr:DNA cytosine methyltransferase [Haloarculaceae archaeon H-GB1-1]
MSGSESRRILDLFSGLGGFSAAFEDSSNWEVTTVEIEEQFDPDICADILDLRPSDFDHEYDVILASPPCTQFSRVGNHDHWDHESQEPTADESRDAVALVLHTVGLIRGLSPNYWFLENPLGRLRWVLGQPTAMVTYCQYGRPHMKPTDLWGSHPPMTYRRCNEGDDCHDSNRPARDGGHGGMHGVEGYSEDAAERSLVPYELSEAILQAVEGRSRQQSLTELVAADGGYSVEPEGEK